MLQVFVEKIVYSWNEERYTLKCSIMVVLVHKEVQFKGSKLYCSVFSSKVVDILLNRSILF